MKLNISFKEMFLSTTTTFKHNYLTFLELKKRFLDYKMSGFKVSEPQSKGALNWWPIHTDLLPQVLVLQCCQVEGRWSQAQCWSARVLPLLRWTQSTLRDWKPLPQTTVHDRHAPGCHWTSHRSEEQLRTDTGLKENGFWFVVSATHSLLHFGTFQKERERESLFSTNSRKARQVYFYSTFQQQGKSNFT